MEKRKYANRQQYKPLFSQSNVIYNVYFNTTATYLYSVVIDVKNTSVFCSVCIVISDSGLL